MVIPRKFITLLSALALAGSAFVISSSPAQAGLIGTGPAVVHVDASSAKLTKQADGSYSLMMPKRTSGQWMGVRFIKGQKDIRVGNLTAEQLSSGWNRLLYTSSPVRGTLTWKDSCCAKQSFMPVRVVGKPKRTPNGVIFKITSTGSLPSTPNNVFLHLAQAPNKAFRSQSSSSVHTKQTTQASEDPISTFPYTQTENVVDDLWVSSENENANSVELRIYNFTNNNTCWSTTWNNVAAIPGGVASVSVPNNTCDNVSYTDHISDTVGAEVQLQSTNGTGVGYSSFLLDITPPNQDTYTYQSTFVGWYWN